MPVLFIITCWMVLLLTPFDFSYAASPAPAKIESIQVTPTKAEQGKYPVVTAYIRSQTRQREEVSIVAVLTRPDKITKSWHWKKFVLVPGKTASVALPKEYSTKLAGIYKVEFVIYSADMRRRLYADSRSFVIGDVKTPPSETPENQQLSSWTKNKRRVHSGERSYFGIGAYGNTLNPAGGVTLMLWPFRDVVIQGIYTAGEFTSYEGRLLVKFTTAPRFTAYAGVGYLSVSKQADVIGVSTEFKDSTVSGVFGVEVPLGRRILGYLEIMAASIDLQKDVTSGGSSAHATVKYAPVTVGLGIVFSLL